MCLSDQKAAFAFLGMRMCCILELWLIEAQPIGRKGAGLQQLQLVPIGRLSPQTKFGLDSMLQTEVMAL